MMKHRRLSYQSLLSLLGGRFSLAKWLGTLGLLFLFSCSSPESKSKALKFPAGFHFGTSIAGFQGDFGCPTLPAEQCEDRASDWYQWVTDPAIIGEGQDKEADRALRQKTFSSGDPLSYGPGHWELYAQDYKMMKDQLSANAHRMGLEWSRLFPKSTVGITGHEALKKVANLKALETYRKMLEALKAQGIKPYVTINHYTLPLWIHDGVACYKDLKTCKAKGWLDDKTTLTEIAKFAGFVGKEFGDLIDNWITINEPFAIILPGYVQPSQDRVNPPGLSLRIPEAKKVAFALIESHARIYQALKKNDTVDADGDGKPSYIGIAYNAAPIAPQDPKRNTDVEGAKSAHYLLNHVFFEALVNGKLDAKLDGKLIDRPDLKGLDWIGINYYGRFTVKGDSDAPFPALSPILKIDPLSLKNEMVYPKGLYQIIMDYHDKYKLPIVITENGYGMKDPKADGSKAVEYMVRHLFWVHRAIQEGAKVEGYLYWSFVDNFEWNHGFDFRFGLFKIDVNDKSKKRIARPGAATFQSIAKSGTIPEVLFDKLNAEEKKLIIPPENK